MSDMDFSDLGRDIEEKINKFINSNEMKDLQDNIRETVEKTMDEVRRSAKEAADYMSKNVEIRWESGPQKDNKTGACSDPAAGEARDSGNKNAGTADNGTANARTANAEPTFDAWKKKAAAPVRAYGKRQLPVIRKPKGRVSGVLMTVFGTCGAVIGIAKFFQLIGSIDSFASVGITGMNSLGLAAVTALLCTVIAAVGGVLRRRAKRFRHYVKTMGNKDFYSISSLAQAVGEKEKYVVKDIRKMIRRKWFREGHLDEQASCFMLTDEAYRMYLDAQQELIRRREEEKRLEQEREMLEQDPVRKQLKLTVEEGREYIRRIRKTNDDIPGEEISEKLYRLEKVCTRIFSHVEENPEKLADIRKFMSYYLPTTLKLVETYYEFSIQPVQGENITTAKNEIEEMLDHINQAFEKMFDKLFEDDAMDISTDISVLSTMLVQEGLLEDEFKVK